MMARVLVVDDSAFMRTVILEVLAAGGHQVIGEADDGVDALEKFQVLRPDLTTLDIAMPLKDGIVTLVKIVTIDSRACVVMCSASGQEPELIEAINLGAKDFVVKPLQAEHLLEAVGKALPQE